MGDFISIYMTATSASEADRIAKALVGEKLAACVNIFPEVHSIYAWEGKVEEVTEVALIAKGRMATFEALKKLVKALHSQSVPCIVATPITAGHQPYMAWLEQETKA